MGFWSSFWRETGKNTGKWASNKIFGRGWSTPYSHDVTVTRDTSSGSSGNNTGERNVSSLQDISAFDSEEAARTNRILDEDFSDDPMALFNQVSDFVAQLNTRTIGIQSSSKRSALLTKAKHGILLMEMKGMHDAAAEFRGQLRQYRFKQFGRYVLALVFLGALILGLMVIANS
jgi:hypothetical protein